MRNRVKLPERRFGHTQVFEIYTSSGQVNLYLRTGEYSNGKLGEIFLNLEKEGSTLKALADSFAIVFSIALQYGVPLELLVNKFLMTKFEPSGLVRGHLNIKRCSSILDAVVRHLGIIYLDRKDLGHMFTEV
ncbi:MAG: hypothetical protein GWN01_09405 [Nitrosopumilaceae archaeon]|nr:hypothetical protein [Nitrosopumilaceae archaeon]NIU87825.1 hypothetical protein [Nitrosopumilaceae archaeon]NIV65207.1 hypothetical protein [Nitrosopumilaceae archaeon]NIX61723.1 hypothetical protein [Nitrosopumilaceae archaeon]